MIFHEARSTRDALKILNDDCEILPIAGGTDLIIQWRDGKQVKGFVDIGSAQQLKGIIERKNWLTIKSATTHTEIINDENIQKLLPTLAIACSQIGSPAIRNKGTIGGNLLNASPASDLAPVLLAYDASLILESINNAREIKIADFYKEYRKTEICNNELLTRIIIPPPYNNEVSNFYKIGSRKEVSIAKANACFRIHMDANVVIFARIALGSVAETPIRLREIEDILIGNTLNNELIKSTIDALIQAIKPIDDVRSTAIYRQKIITNWLSNFLSNISQ